MHFFTELDKLVTESRAYGPVSGSLTTKYNVTSEFDLTGKSKAFACQAGMIMVVQSQADPSLVNVILRPKDGTGVALSKIQYYVYRGLLKNSFITGTAIKPQTDLDNSDYIKYLWNRVSIFKTFFSVTEDPSPVSFGYWEPPLPDSIKIDSMLNAIENSDPKYWLNYNHVKEGDWIGDFGTHCGFEIICEYDNQKIDIGYLAKGSHEIDVSTLLTDTIAEQFKVKTEREKILNYIDPAAFWGLYFKKGVDFWNSATNKKETAIKEGLYNNIIAKYSTKNNIYLELKGIRGRSINFYEAIGQISFDIQASARNLIDYETDSWPILIKNFPASATEIKELQFSFRYRIGVNIQEQDVSLSVYFKSLNKFISSENIFVKSPPPTNLLITQSQSKLIEHLPTNSLNLSGNYLPVANIFKAFILNHQTQPILNYFDNLWQANYVSNLLQNTEPPSFNSYWRVSTKKRIVDLLGQNLKNVLVTSRIFFDKGKNSAGDIKSRRLYQSVITDASEINKNLIVNSLKDGFENTPKKENYYKTLYDNLNYQIYKGKIDDGGNIINSLTFINTDDFELKQSYFQLGITDEEFNRLYYNANAVPDPLPDPLITPPHIPQDAQNVFLHLEEDTSIPATKIFRKFKLGLRYEDNTGTLQNKLPTTDVTIYTVDGLFFFSQEYADYQEFYEEFAKCKAEFRVKLPFAGEFGFDWMRIGDTGAAGDVDYYNIVGKLYSDAAHTILETDKNKFTGHFLKDENSFKRFEFEYNNFPIQFELSNNFKKYYIPKLSIYPPYSVPSAMIKDLDRQPVFEISATNPLDIKVNREANLRILLDVKREPSSIELKFETDIFEIPDVVINKTVGTRNFDILVKCKKEFGTKQYIKVIAFYPDSKNGKAVGLLEVLPNIKTQRYTKKIVLVDVKTNINALGTPPSLRIPIKEQALNLKKYLRQIYATPIIDTETIDLISTPDMVFETKYLHTDISGTKFILVLNLQSPISPIQRVTDYLFSKLDTIKYSDYIPIFLFHNDSGFIDSTGNFQNFAGGTVDSPGSNIGKIVISQSSTKATGVHETLHALNVPHSFTNLNENSNEVTKNAKFTFGPMKTDNILDYSHNATPAIKRVSLWNWQAKIAINKMDYE